MATVKEDLVERVGQALEAALPEGTEIITPNGVRKGKGAKAKITKAKQDDLPTMEEHQKKIAEIEDLADAQLDLMDQMSSLKEKVKEADENLVASMKRHDRTYYSRQTWGSVVLTEAKVKAKVKKQVATSNVDEESDDSTEE